MYLAEEITLLEYTCRGWVGKRTYPPKLVLRSRREFFLTARWESENPDDVSIKMRSLMVS